MPTTSDINSWIDTDLIGAQGEKVGKIDHVYLDRQTGEPTFAAVKTGLFGTSSSLVPIDAARSSADGVQVSFSKDQIKDAPRIDADDELSEAEEKRLYKHYGLGYSAYDGDDHESFGARETAGHDTGARETVGHDTSGPTTDDAMTRSEEELRVGTRQVEAGKARLRKYIVTEHVTKTIPVQREEVRIEREPITDANRGDALDGPAISEEEHEVVLHAEEPVVEKTAVAKERVRLATDTKTEDVEVTEEVRKERIDETVDGTGTTDRR